MKRNKIERCKPLKPLPDVMGKNIPRIYLLKHYAVETGIKQFWQSLCSRKRRVPASTLHCTDSLIKCSAEGRVGRYSRRSWASEENHAGACGLMEEAREGPILNGPRGYPRCLTVILGTACQCLSNSPQRRRQWRPCNHHDVDSAKKTRPISSPGSTRWETRRLAVCRSCLPRTLRCQIWVSLSESSHRALLLSGCEQI